MNKNYALLAGGALLATTALTSAADAASIRNDVAAGDSLKTWTALATSSTLWTSTTTGVDLSNANFAVDFTANLTIALDISVEFTGGSPSGATPTVTFFSDTGGSLVAAGGGSGTYAVQVLPTRLLITNVQPSAGNSVGAMVVSAMGFSDAAGLSVAGTSITASGGGAYQTGTQTLLESVTAGTAIVTSKAPANTVITAQTSVIASTTSTVPFTRVVVTGTGIASTTATRTASLATVLLTQHTDTIWTSDLAVTIAVGNYISAIEVKLTHPALSATYVQTAQFGSTLYSKTSAQFQSGSVTFTPTATDLAAAKDVIVVFDGTTVIGAHAAGTVQVTYGGTAVHPSSLAQANGTATAITLGGLSSEINTAQPSINSFDSYVRITNTSSVAGAATIVVLNGNTGVTLGSGNYVSASIPAGSTLQIGMDTIEAALGITSTVGVPYTLRISGPFNGYTQHIMFSPVTGALGDLSGFRQGGSAAGSQTAP